MLQLSSKKVERIGTAKSALYIVGFIALVIIGMWLRDANFN